MNKRIKAACAIILLSLLGFSIYIFAPHSSVPTTTISKEKYTRAWQRYTEECRKNNPRLFPIPYSIFAEDRAGQESARKRNALLRMYVSKKTKMAPVPEEIRWKASLDYSYTARCRGQQMSWAQELLDRAPPSGMPRITPAVLDQQFDVSTYCCTVPQPP